MTAERRAALLAYCRIDELAPEEYSLFDALYLSATAYMEQAGISEPPECSARRAQYDLCVNALVLDAWDSRGASADGKVAENPSFRRRLNQLKFSEPQEADDERGCRRAE